MFFKISDIFKSNTSNQNNTSSHFGHSGFILPLQRQAAREVVRIETLMLIVTSYLLNTLAIFHLALTMGIPRWEIEESKWKRTVRGNCGTLGGRWQVGNHQWKVGNNVNWFRPLTAQFRLLPVATMMCFPISPGGYHSNILDLLLQLLIIMMEQHVNF